LEDKMPFHTTVRGRLRDADPDAAREAHNGVVARIRPRTTSHGGVGHRVYAAVDDPREFLAFDTWESVEGIQAAFGDEAIQKEIGGLFESPPEVRIWTPREGWTAF
jgi:quinol monooxygenase YgiN